MKETVTLLLFISCLGGCILLGIPVLFALAAGEVIFCVYAYSEKKRPGEIGRMLLRGASTSKNILCIMLAIGMLTASWRAGGTIAFVLYHTMSYVNLQFFTVFTFALCCLVSWITGTSFGTASTVGVICMMLSNAAGLSPEMTGGAILSGIFFGDRCSPVSSSAHMVCACTGTEIYGNMKRMMRTACVPLVISVLLYLILPAGGEGELDLTILSALKAQFVFHPLVLLPIVLLLALLLFRVKVTQAILCSVAAAVGCMIWVQQVPWQQLPQILWGGYHNAGSVVSTAGSAAGFSSPELATMMDGGGVVSMLEVSAVVLISTSYSGIFEETGLMKGVTRGMKKLARRVSRFGAVLSASILSGMLSCNQSLSILLTRQLCDGIYDSPEDLAIGIENGAVVTSSLIPWNIAGSIPLAMIGGSEKSLWFAFYLIAIPAWNLLLDLWKEKRGRPLQV